MSLYLFLVLLSNKVKGSNECNEKGSFCFTMILDLFLERYLDYDSFGGPSSWTDAAGDDYMSRNLDHDDYWRRQQDDYWRRQDDYWRTQDDYYRQQEECDEDCALGAFFFFIFFVAAIVGCCCCCFNKNCRRQPQEDLREPAQRLESPPPEIPAGGETPQENAEPTVDDYIALYKRAFRKKKQQQKVLPSQLFQGDPTKANGGEITGKNDESIDSALVSARSYRFSHRGDTDVNDGDESDDSGDDDSVIFSKETSSTNQNDSICLFHPRDDGLDAKKKRVIGVHCTICLEDIKAKKRIVWSETESCPHIFHKKCLVPFLAFNKERQMKLPPHRRHEVQNPCPICRQSFITLDPDP